MGNRSRLAAGTNGDREGTIRRRASAHFRSSMDERAPFVVGGPVIILAAGPIRFPGGLPPVSAALLAMEIGMEVIQASIGERSDA